VNVVAFRHNLSDPEIVLSFAAEVGSIRRLELLVVHTYADLVAVGPGVATDWKVQLIETLYRRTRHFFDSGNLPGSPDDPEIDSKRNKVRQRLDQQAASEDCYQLLEEVPLSLLSRALPEQLADNIELVCRDLSSRDGTLCTCRFDEHFKAMRFTVIRREHERSIGTFARATGALTTSRLEILRAQIEMVGEYAWDDFWVTDPAYPGVEAPEERMNEVREGVRHLLDSPDEPLPPHPQCWKSQRVRESDSVNVLPTKVVFDNETVDRYTILSFFAYDQVGLLYRIAATLAEKRVVLHFAKIDTHLDQVADVFYVSEEDGSKLSSRQRRRDIRDALLKIAGSHSGTVGLGKP
jgi:[protein-PII] uridylyltransferase